MESSRLTGEFVLETTSHKFQAKKAPQLLAAFALSLTTLSLGCGVTWTSPSIPDLERKHVFDELTTDQKTWIASLLTFGALACGPFSGFIIDKLGRKLSIMVLTVPMAVGWGLISSGYSVPVMYVGRFLTGFAIGGNTHIGSVYAAEIFEDRIRGVLISVTYVACAVGILYIYVLGTFASWFVLSVTNVMFPVLLLILMFFLPESPIFLMSKGKKKDATKALMWLRGADTTEQISFELKNLQSQITQSQGENIEPIGVWKALQDINAVKALSISVGLMCCQQLSGVNAVLFYTLTIFEAAGTNVDPNVSSIIIGVVLLCAILLNMVLIDRFGRTFLLKFSQTGMSLSLFALGIFFYLKKQNDGVTPAGLSLLPLVSLIIFMVAYNVGAGPIPWLMMGELLPSSIKGFGCAFATSFNWMMAFAVTKSFDSLISLLDIHGCYFLFGGISFVGLVFCVLCVPETKGKTLDEIQKLHFSK